MRYELLKDANPRETLFQKGREALANADLIAVLLGTGTKNIDVFTLAAKIAETLFSASQEEIASELSRVAGLGSAQQARIQAALELGRRYYQFLRQSIRHPEDVLPHLWDISARNQEYFVSISLNGAHEIIRRRTISIGLLNSSQIHPREVFAPAISDRAAALILAHNHPSGQVYPSENDRAVQVRLREAGRLLGIEILDHLIVSGNKFFSFQEQGLT